MCVGQSSRNCIKSRTFLFNPKLKRWTQNWSDWAEAVRNNASFISGTILALFPPICRMSQANKGKGGGGRWGCVVGAWAGFCSCCAPGGLASTLVGLDPLSGTRKNPKGRLAPREPNAACCLRPVWRNGRLVYSKTDRKGTWSLVSEFQPVLCQNVQTHFLK